MVYPPKVALQRNIKMLLVKDHCQEYVSMLFHFRAPQSLSGCPKIYRKSHPRSRSLPSSCPGTPSARGNDDWILAMSLHGLYLLALHSDPWHLLLALRRGRLLHRLSGVPTCLGIIDHSLLEMISIRGEASSRKGTGSRS